MSDFDDDDFMVKFVSIINYYKIKFYHVFFP